MCSLHHHPTPCADGGVPALWLVTRTEKCFTYGAKVKTALCGRNSVGTLVLAPLAPLEKSIFPHDFDATADMHLLNRKVVLCTCSIVK